MGTEPWALNRTALNRAGSEPCGTEPCGTEPSGTEPREGKVVRQLWGREENENAWGRGRIGREYHSGQANSEKEGKGKGRAKTWEAIIWMITFSTAAIGSVPTVQCRTVQCPRFSAARFTFQSLALNRAALNRAALNRPALNRGH
uniref:Uncharacterized protein n=1 Tax=Globodera rostochiensis TaxID=31243 RepID=A0A914HQL9_GLORO